MRKIEVQWFESKYSLSEISQGSGFLFSFLSAPKDGNKQVHQYIKCRDFLIMILVVITAFQTVITM